LAGLPEKVVVDRNGMPGLLLLSGVLVLFAQFADKMAEAFGIRFGVSVFFAEIEIKPQPLLVVRVIGGKNLFLDQQRFVWGKDFWGDWDHDTRICHQA